jgi:hypothetical protein
MQAIQNLLSPPYSCNPSNFHVSKSFPTSSSPPTLFNQTTTMSKPIVLHIGDPIVYNPEIYAKFSDQFTVIRPSLEERQRPAFLQALKDRKWGDFQAVFRPFWNTGGEMGRWDAEMIPLLPKSMKLFASAGAGYDWADVDLLANEGGFNTKSMFSH